MGVQWIGQEKGKAAAAPAHEVATAKSQLAPSKAGKEPIPAKPKQEVLEPDPIEQAAHKIENLPDEATALARAKELVLKRVFNNFELGGVLQRIKENHWFGGHATFDELCEHAFGFRQAQGYRLIQVYYALGEAGITWAAVEAVGWSKVALMCRKLPPAEISTRVEEFKPLTYLEAKKKLAEEEADTPQPKPKVITFKPHPDQLAIIQQAIAKCKKESGTKHDTVALEYVCLDFLAGPTLKAKPGAGAEPSEIDEQGAPPGEPVTGPSAAPLATPDVDDEVVVKWMVKAGADKAVALFEKAFPDLVIQVAPFKG